MRELCFIHSTHVLLKLCIFRVFSDFLVRLTSGEKGVNQTGKWLVSPISISDKSKQLHLGPWQIRKRQIDGSSTAPGFSAHNNDGDQIYWKFLPGALVRAAIECPFTCPMHTQTPSLMLNKPWKRSGFSVPFWFVSLWPRGVPRVYLKVSFFRNNSSRH